MRKEDKRKRDIDALVVELLGGGCTLYAHKDVLYICTSQEGHLHALGEGPCQRPCPLTGSCSWDEVRRLAQRYERDLWALLAYTPCFATCYDVDTATWHPEWIAVDDAGQPYALPPD